MKDCGHFVEEKPAGSNLFTVVDRLDPEWANEHLRTTVRTALTAVLPSDDPMAQALVQVPSRMVLTFNYDLLLEHTARSAGLSPVTLTNKPGDLEAPTTCWRTVPNQST